MDSKEMRWTLADRIGNDIFALSEGGETKHSLLASVVIAIAGGLIVAFLAEAIGVENAAKRTRETIRQLIENCRKNTASEDKSYLTEANALLSKSLPRELIRERLDKAQRVLAKTLMECGVQCTPAERISAAVRDVVGTSLGQSD